MDVLGHCDVGNRVKNGKKWVVFYGMELPRVGAFTENRGSGYRNPVQILREKWEIYVFSVFPGLV